MAKEFQHAYETAPLYSWMGAASQAPLGAWARAGEAWEEIARFATGRLQKDSETGRQVAGCRDWAEMMRLHQQWLTSTAHDYAQLMGRLAQMAAGFGADVARSSSQSAEDAAETSRSAARATSRRAAD